MALGIFSSTICAVRGPSALLRINSAQLTRASVPSHISQDRGVAQLARVSALGAEGREFESRRPDQIIMKSVHFPLVALVLCACTACTLQPNHTTESANSSSSTSSFQESSEEQNSVTSSEATIPALTFGENSILNTADILKVPLTVRSKTGGMIDLNILTKNKIVHIVTYNEQLSDGRNAWANIISPENLLYISGIGKNGFSMYDMDGNDRSDGHSFFKNEPFTVSDFYRINENDYAYGIHSVNTGSGDGKKPIAGIYLHNISNGTERVFPMEKVGLKSLEGIQPLCMSSDNASLYLRYEGWEGFSYSAIWKLRLSDMHAEKVFDMNDKIYTYHCGNHHDLILGVRTEVNDALGMGGDAWPPTSLVLFNGANGTSKTLLTFKDQLIKSAFLTPDGRNIVYVLGTQAPYSHSPNNNNPFTEADADSELFMMSVDGSGNHSIGHFHTIAGMSRDGKIVIAGDPAGKPFSDGVRYTVLNTENNQSAVLTNDGYAQILQCNYGQGFDCEYQ